MTGSQASPNASLFHYVNTSADVIMITPVTLINLIVIAMVYKRNIFVLAGLINFAVERETSAYL